MLRAVLLVALLSPALGGAQGPANTSADAPRQGPPALAALLSRADEAYDRRDAPGKLDELRAALDAAEKLAPDDHGVLWRQSRLYFWLADDPNLGKREKSKLGKRGWDYGERAIQVDPKRVEGWHFAAAGMGNYALGLGIFKALSEGIEGKFKDRLSHAEALDPDFQNGAIQTAWGRFWFELPWPKYDGGKSERALKAALAKNPDNVRAHVYLADLYLKEHAPAKAEKELARAVADPPGRYDAAEEKRWQQVARRMLSSK